MILIPSAKYIEPAMQAEFGKIPPTFMPIGNKRVFEHQLEFLQEEFGGEKVFISLPEDFKISKKDLILLKRFNINQLFIPKDINLSESILRALNMVGEHDDHLYILHGDTYVKKAPQTLDCISVFQTKDAYLWETEKTDSRGEIVWCGFFSFADQRIFIRSLSSSHDNFVKAVRSYDKVRSLEKKFVGSWLDLGHINTYYKARAHFGTQRGFNSINVNNGFLVKSGEPAAKIQSEARWFNSLPRVMKRYTPKFISDSSQYNNASYTLEYLYHPPLNELFVHARNPAYFWKRIFDHCKNYFDDCQEAGEPIIKESHYDVDSEAKAILNDKTWDRLDIYSQQTGTDLHKETSINGYTLPSIYEIAELCIHNAINNTSPIPGILHGDFCLSNIFYDFRADCIKVIDPRGLNSNGQFSIVGDLRYDLAKLTHSIIGGYDFIISGAFECTQKNLEFEFKIYEEERVKEVKKLFMTHSFLPNINIADVMPITILLFLSMLPLHSDNVQRQQALLSNSLLMFKKYLMEDYR